MKQVAFLISCFFWIPVNAQLTTNRAAQLKADLKTLRDSLSTSYPSLYRYNTPAQINTLFKESIASVHDSTTDIQFVGTVRRIVSALKDGHMYASVPATVKQELSEHARFFPLRLYFDLKGVYLVNPISEKIPPGSEVLSINGKPVSAIKERLYKFIPSDAGVTSKKRHILNNAFHFYYLLGYGQRQNFIVVLKTPNGKLYNKTVKAVSEANIPARIPDAESEGLDFIITKDGMAVMIIPSFEKSVISKQKLNFEQFLQSAFAQLAQKNISKLIIDLRNNGGGKDTYGSLLYSYLSSKPFGYYKELVVKTSKLPYSQFNSATTSFNNLQPNFLEQTVVGFKLKKEAHNNLNIIRPSKPVYNGEVVVLTNGLTFSTAAEFCAIAKSNRRGVFVGEETAGGIRGNTSGVINEVKLNYSGITVSYGLVEYQLQVSTVLGCKGIIPDKPISVSLSDVLHHQDPQLKFAFQLLRK